MYVNINHFCPFTILYSPHFLTYPHSPSRANFLKELSIGGCHHFIFFQLTKFLASICISPSKLLWLISLFNPHAVKFKVLFLSSYMSFQQHSTLLSTPYIFTHSLLVACVTPHSLGFSFFLFQFPLPTPCLLLKIFSEFNTLTISESPKCEL